MYFLLKMGIIHCYVSLPEGMNDPCQVLHSRKKNALRVVFQSPRPKMWRAMISRSMNNHHIYIYATAFSHPKTPQKLYHYILFIPHNILLYIYLDLVVFLVVNVGQYIIHGCYGAMGTNVIIKGSFVSGHYLLLSHPKEFNTVYLYQLCRWFGEWQSRIGRATGSGLGCTATLQTRLFDWCVCVFVVGIPFNVFWIHHHHKGLRGLEYDDVVVVVVVVELFVLFCFFLVIFKWDLHRKPCCLHEDPIGVTAELCKVVHLNLNPKSGIWRPRSYGSIDRRCS